MFYLHKINLYSIVDVTQRPPRVALDYKKTTVFNHQYRSNNDYLNSIEFANIIYIYVYLFRKITSIRTYI